MSSRKEKGTQVKKKHYVKPEVKQVQLRPEEAVLAICKLPGQYGPTVMGCQALGQACFATHS